MQVKRIIDHDPRYDAVESSDMREDIFRDYCRRLEAEDEEEMAKKEDERRQRDRKARYDFIDLDLIENLPLLEFLFQ